MDEASAERIRQRIENNRAEILHSIRMADMGNPLAAEPQADRRRARLQTKANLSPREAEVFDSIITAKARGTEERDANAEALTAAATTDRPPEPGRGGAEKVYGNIDFVNVSFLDKGARIARAVGRVAFRNGLPQGTGFLIGNGLFMTNHHVVPNAAFAANLMIEFDYELDLTGNAKPATRFAIDTSVFVTDSDAQDGLDFAIFAVGEKLSGPHPLELFGWSGLSESADKHMLGEFVNIVQHPQGRYKEVVLRENRLVGRGTNALHYVADTEPGSSGSPVFNSEWRPVALHHWGGPWALVFGDDGQKLPIEVNEGIRISSIVRNLRSRLAELPLATRERLTKALDEGGAPESPGDHFEPDAATTARAGGGGGTAAAPRIDPDGRVTWTLPVELSVQIPLLARGERPAPAGPAAATAALSEADAERRSIQSYADRGGYKARFIEGFDVPLPRLAPELIEHAARNKLAEAGDDPFELKYHHFSVVMNAQRRMAFFTACNIDGLTAKEIDRKNKTVKPLRPDSPGLESISQADAEAESWRHDPRIERTQVTAIEFYEKQRVPGFPDPNADGRIARMFQKGHLVRRLDPAWGDDAMALLAEADSFHWTNAAPQVGFFNQGSARRSLPGTGGGRLWRAVENLVLRNAVAEKSRVTSFTGPIFADDDRAVRGIKVPMRFFKIAVWADGGELRSLAMIADQSKVIEVWPEALFNGGVAEAIGAEAFTDPQELDKVEDFLTTIADIEALTSLDFGAEVRSADIRVGSGCDAVTDESEVPFKPTGAAKRRTGGRRAARPKG